MNREATDLAGVRHQTYDTLGSTNAEALALARAGERGPLWVSARHQSAGRGRRGRTWVSEPGNLYASLLLVDPAPAERAAELSFVTGLAVRDAIAQTASALGPKLALKWPNDVLLDGEKVAGILIEGEVTRGAPATVVAGVGVNCASHPHAASYPATDLAAHGSNVTPQSLLVSLSTALFKRIAQWDRGSGFAGIRGDWLSAAHGLGQPMRVSDGGGERTGQFAGLDDAGRLLLDLPDGSRQQIAAGDVFPHDPARRPARSGLAGLGMAAPQQLVFAPLGGVGEIGMNLSIYGLGDERRRQWLAVDLGVSFAGEEHLPGVDLILPDIRYLVEERQNLAGIVLTHAHEDHFGALLDLWPKLKVPVYATPFTAALLEAKRASEPGAPEIPVNDRPARRPVQCSGRSTSSWCRWRIRSRNRMR